MQPDLTFSFITAVVDGFIHVQRLHTDLSETSYRPYTDLVLYQMATKPLHNYKMRQGIEML